MATSQIIYGGLSANTFSATTIYLGNNQLSSNTTFTGGTVTGQTFFTSGVTITGDTLINDTSGITALDTSTRELVSSNSQPSIDWENRLMLDPTGVQSINWLNRFVSDDLGVSAIEWTSSKRNLYDAGNALSMDWISRQTIDSIGTQSIDWENRQLIDENGLATLVWSSQKTLEDLFGTSLDWGNKYLYKSDGSVVLDWENGIITGQTNIESSIISATTISATTLYGDGSNLTNVGGSSYIYEIGEYVVSEGGVIAHRWISTISLGSPSGGTVQNYLVLDTTDLSTATIWSTGTTNISDVESFWDGLTNTNNLISAGDALGITPTSAAGLCYNSTNNGKTDWYLPSIGELAKVNSNRWEISQGLSIAGGTQIGNSVYWSSTELTGILSWAFNFDSSVTTSQTKTTSSYDVRAMRKFSI